MQVIAFVTQKGGSGKTTLAFCCAVAAQEHGAKVLLLDMDAQGTAEAWYQDREADTPQLARVDAVHLTQALEAAQAQGFDLCCWILPGGMNRRRRLPSGRQIFVLFRVVLHQAI